MRSSKAKCPHGLTRKQAIVQDAYIFFVLHDSYQRPNWANPFVTRRESRTRLGIYSAWLANSKNTKLMQISLWLLDRGHKIAATERISYKH